MREWTLGWSGSGTSHVVVLAAAYWSGWNPWTIDSPPRFHGELVVVMADYAETPTEPTIDSIAVEILTTTPPETPLQPTSLNVARSESTERTNPHEISAEASAEGIIAVAQNARREASSEMNEAKPEHQPPERTEASIASPAVSNSVPKPLGHELFDQPAQLSSSPLPRYPAEWKARGMSGTSLLRLHIGASGRVEKAELVQSSGFSELDESALQATRHWIGRPRMLEGRAVPSQVLLPVVFE